MLRRCADRWWCAARLLSCEFTAFGGREWAGKLPIGRSESDQARRNELFKQFDPNGNGFLSLAEVDKGVHDILGLEARMRYVLR